MRLREILNDHVSNSAFKIIDGELRVVGKYGQIEIVGKEFDIWLIKPNLQPISTRRIRSVAKIPYITSTFIELSGEAWFRIQDPKELIKLLPIIGVRKRRRDSPERIAELKTWGKGLSKIKK